MKLQTLAFVLVLTTLPFAGCIQNMTDLKDRLGAGDEEAVQPAAVVEPSVTTPTPQVNTTVVTKPPVARMSVFGSNGALLYKASFVAEDAAEPIIVEEKASLNAIASDSEALQPGATIAKYSWTLDGKAVADTRQTTVTLDAPGLHQLTLVVTDSHGKSDNQTLQIGVQPPAFDVETTLATGPIAGALGLPGAADVSFDLTLEAAGVPAAIAAVKFVASPDATCDASLTILNAEEKQMGRKDAAGHPDDQTETVVLGALPVGSYIIRVAPEACPPQASVPIKVIVTYLPSIEGLAGGDGGHAGH